MLGIVALMTTVPASAQSRRISGTVSDDIDVVVGANVKEIDKNNRIVSQAITDFNGNFTMTIKDPKNTLKVSYIGYKEYATPMGVGDRGKRENMKCPTTFLSSSATKDNSGI